jgi:3',5'-cyclic AMP phosphodiesterase CpdA
VSPPPLRLRRGAALVCCLLATVAACRDTGLPPSASRATSTVVHEIDVPPGTLALPLRDGSVRFAAIGDSGRGDQAQHEVAAQMIAWRERFPFDFVVMLGDNVYDSHTPEDYAAKFEAPYRPLREAGVEFYAAIGNHDDPKQPDYEPFNMGGHRYFTFRKSERRLAGLAGAGVRFFVLDTVNLDAPQLAWLRRELEESGTHWKIAFFHHPVYTSGRYQTAAGRLRNRLEPLLVAGGVDVVLSGHEHFYERLHPQHGIAYFISGAAGSLRAGDIRPTRLTARGFDTDYHFMLFEAAGDELYFQAISRTGETIDAGAITKAGDRK